MLFKPLFSSRKTNSFKIRKDPRYSNKVYNIHLSQYERGVFKNMLEKGTMEMKFVLDKNIHDLKYLANYGSDKDNYGFYSLFGLGDALISVQNKFLIRSVNFYRGIDLFVLLRDDNIDITLLRKILIEEMSSIGTTEGIVKHYKTSNYYVPEKSNSATELLNKNVFEIIKSMCQNDDDSHYRKLMKKFLSEILKLIKKQYSDDMFLYKNVMTDQKSDFNIDLEYSIILLLHYLPKLYIGISLTHIPYVYVHFKNVPHIKTLFVLLKVIGDDMKVSVYEYYSVKESGHKDRYKLLLDIDLKNTKYYNSIFPEIKVHFDNMKNEKVVLISSY